MVAIFNVIWIDPHADNEENRKYLKELDKIWYLKIKSYKNIEEALSYIKELQFVETKIIVRGEIYIQFINSFNENIKDINMIPKIIIFEQNENISFAAQEILNNRFYNFGGIKKTFNERK
jgi:hypothetical protein